MIDSQAFQEHTIKLVCNEWYQCCIAYSKGYLASKAGKKITNNPFFLKKDKYLFKHWTAGFNKGLGKESDSIIEQIDDDSLDTLMRNHPDIARLSPFDSYLIDINTKVPPSMKDRTKCAAIY